MLIDEARRRPSVEGTRNHLAARLQTDARLKESFRRLAYQKKGPRSPPK